MISTEWFSINESSNYILKSVFGEGDYDNNNIYLVAFDEGGPVATGALTLLGDGVKLFNLAVLENYRGQGLGDFVLRLLIRRSYDMGFNNQYAYVPINLAGYFKKLKFNIIDGSSGELLMCHVGDINGGC
jgi:N-acetylglutamate synthase-like GNAT family acetyltransferase